MTDDILKAWRRCEEAKKLLNRAVNEKFHVGQKVKVLWGNRGWVDATVSWVPYRNGPLATHIYVDIPGFKQSKKFEMGGGAFSGVRTGDYDGVKS